MAVALVAGCAAVSKTLQPLGLTSAPGYAYEPRIVGVGGRLAERLEEASILFAKKNEPPATLQGLRRRTQADRDLFLRVLRSRGWYDGEVDSEIDSSKKPAVVSMKVTRGTRYKISRFEIRGLPQDAEGLATPEGLAELGIAVGGPAHAEAVLGAENGLLVKLAERGYPYAELPSRRTTIDRRARTLEVDITVDAGPRARFGDVTVEGLQNVDGRFIVNRLTFRRGEPFSPSKVEESRKALFATGVFSGVSISWGKRGDVAADGTAPIRILVTEGDFHTVGAGLKYSSADGFGGRAFWEHRNVSGKADRFRSEIEVSQKQTEGGIFYRRPDFLHRNQTLLLDAKADADDVPAYERYALSASAGLERAFTKRFVGTAGLTIEQDDVNSASDPEGTKRYTLLGIPLGIRWDGSDSLLDPSKGHRTLASITPWVSVLGDSATIGVLRLTESIYVPLDSKKSKVWAARFQFGSVVGEAGLDIPADKRLYAGGADSVRGYEFQFAGPLVDANEFAPPDEVTPKPRWRPVGGRSLLQVGTELRWKVTDTIGLVPFVEGAGVYAPSFPDFDEPFRVAAGLGFRYFTVAGPIRVDLGFPINPHQHDDIFQIYISLGQAF